MYKIPENLRSKYEFVTLAAKRAEQLQAGAVPRVAIGDTSKVTVVAQNEVAEGKVPVWDPDQQTTDTEVEEE
jgi:DNA-directed RNA polymerase omega subunit